MFERYTEKARRVIFFARAEASSFGSPYIETEHLLLGLVLEDKALAHRFLRSASFESIRTEVDARTPTRAAIPTSVDLPLSSECKNVLGYASEEAERLASSEIGTEHLLLALMREEKSFAAELLRERGAEASVVWLGCRMREQEVAEAAGSSRLASTVAEGIAADFRDVSCRKLGQMTEYLTVCVRKLTDEQIWQRGAEHENTVGNLILHLCGNARQWVVHGVGGAGDVRVRDKEFSAEGGMSGADLIALFEQTMDEAKGVIARVPPERMTERITPQGRDVSVLEAIFQVVSHVHQHVGQIILLTKQMTGTDLDLTIPRPR